MSIWTMAVPVLAGVIDIWRSRSAEVAEKTSLPEDAVKKVGEAVELYLTKDERVIATIMGEIDKARLHDTAMNSITMPPVVNLLRGLVRPLITLAAFAWYVAARSLEIELTAEDYAIIAGILTFWFGVRPFEKRGR